MDGVVEVILFSQKPTILAQGCFGMKDVGKVQSLVICLPCVATGNTAALKYATFKVRIGPKGQ